MNKLDLIIDNIMYAKILKESAHQDELLDEALAAARELQALKPVAWVYRGQLHDLDPVQWSLFPETATPLYALEVTK